jgi:sigma-B regulation protein RsbU (phosphoserine phosphatase)
MKKLRIFQPAIALMDRLKYPQKFAFISFIFILPIGLLMYLYLSEVQSRIDFARKELLGTRYLRSLHQLSEKITTLQLTDQLSTGQQRMKSQINQQQTQVSDRLKALESIDQELARDLGTTNKLNTLKQSWQTAQSHQNIWNYSSQTTQYNLILQALGELRSWVGDQSNLILDPDLDTYYLMDATLLKLPAIQKILIDIQLIAQQAVVRQRLTPMERANLIMLLGNLRDYRNKLASNMEVAFSSNPAGNLRPQLTRPLERLMIDVERVTDSVEALASNSQAVQLKNSLLSTEQSLKKSTVLWNYTIDELDVLLNRRIHGFIQKQFLVTLFVLVILAIITYFFTGFYLGVMKTVSRLSLAAQQMVEGQLTDAVTLDSRDELADVVHSFNQIAVALVQAHEEVTLLNQRLKLENTRMGAELEVTRKLQQMILPKDQELTEIPGLEIAGFMESASEVGGDYYDVLNHQGKIKIGIGDVTGHGLESGVLMIMVQTAVRTLLANHVTDPVQFLTILNQVIYNNVQRMNSDKNLTLSLLDYQEGVLKLSGQHEEMIVVRSQGEIERIDTIDLGFPVGLEADIADFISQTQIKLNSGDVVVLYTDGITEAEDANGRFYGVERLCEIVQHHRQQSPSAIREAIIKDIRQHIGQQKLYDDITFLVFKQR